MADRGSSPDIQQAREQGEQSAKIASLETRCTNLEAACSTLRTEHAAMAARLAVIESQWGSHSALIARYVAPTFVVAVVETVKFLFLKR